MPSEPLELPLAVQPPEELEVVAVPVVPGVPVLPAVSLLTPVSVAPASLPPVVEASAPPVLQVLLAMSQAPPVGQGPEHLPPHLSSSPQFLPVHWGVQEEVSAPTEPPPSPPVWPLQKVSMSAQQSPILAHWSSQ